MYQRNSIQDLFREWRQLLQKIMYLSVFFTLTEQIELHFKTKSKVLIKNN